MGDLTDYVVTRWYRAPELILQCSRYFEAVDLWSTGCIHVEILARKPLFPGENHIDMLKRIGATLGFNHDRDLNWLQPGKERDDALRLVKALELGDQPPKPLKDRLPSWPDDCLDFVGGMLMFDPTKRPSAAASLSHPYIVHLSDPKGETVAARPFNWEFDRFEPTKEILRELVYKECARLHPEILERDGGGTCVG